VLSSAFLIYFYHRSHECIYDCRKVYGYDADTTSEQKSEEWGIYNCSCIVSLLCETFRVPPLPNSFWEWRYHTSYNRIDRAEIKCVECLLTDSREMKWTFWNLADMKNDNVNLLLFVLSFVLLFYQHSHECILLKKVFGSDTTSKQNVEEWGIVYYVSVPVSITMCDRACATPPQLSLWEWRYHTSYNRIDRAEIQSVECLHTTQRDEMKWTFEILLIPKEKKNDDVNSPFCVFSVSSFLPTQSWMYTTEESLRFRYNLETYFPILFIYLINYVVSFLIFYYLNLNL